MRGSAATTCRVARTASSTGRPASRLYLNVARSARGTRNSLARVAPSQAGAHPMERNRIKTHIPGLDEALQGGIPEGFVVLLSGAPGTMKSSLAFSILYQNALKEGRKGAYFTLEQGKDLLLEHMAALGAALAKAQRIVSLADTADISNNVTFLQGRGT